MRLLGAYSRSSCVGVAEIDYLEETASWSLEEIAAVADTADVIVIVSVLEAAADTDVAAAA